MVAILFGASAVPASGAIAVPDRPNAWVLDNANSLSPPAETRINAELEDYNRRTGNQVAVLIIPTLNDESIENYATDVFAKWGVGEKGKDNGALLILSMQDRAGRIEVGYGLEGELTDIEAKAILDQQVFPRLRSGNVDEAVLAGQQAIRAAAGDTNATAPAPAPVQSTDIGSGSASAIFGFAVLASMLFAFGGRRRRGRMYGSSAGWGPGFGTGYGLGGGFGGGGGGGFGGFGGGMSGGGGAGGSW